jgi:hypothetical protein
MFCLFERWRELMGLVWLILSCRAGGGMLTKLKSQKYWRNLSGVIVVEV